MPAFIGSPGSTGTSILAVARVIPENSSSAAWFEPSAAGSDELRRIAHAYEQAHDWKDRHPTL